MKYRFFILFLFILNCQFGYSQLKPVKPQIENDSEAEKYLKALQGHFSKLKSYRLSYKMTIKDANDKATNLSGIYTGSQEQFSVETNELKSVSNSILQWTVNKVDKEIQIQKFKPNTSNKIESPLDIIKRYKSLFKYRIKEVVDKNIVTIELIPLNKNSSYFKVDLTVNIKTNQIVSSKLYDKGGNRMSFLISKHEENLVLPKDYFTVNPALYKDFELLDMR